MKIKEVIIADLTISMTSTLILYIDDTICVPDTEISDENESMQDTVEQEKIDKEKMTDKISIVKETVILNDLDKRALDRSNTIEIEKVQ